MKLISNLIPINGTTLIHGRSGCGKTYGIIKFLNANNIEPVLIDFDENDSSLFKCVHLDGYKIAKCIDDIEFNKLKDKVTIVDTYAMALNVLGSKESLMGFLDKIKDAGSTLIVVAHTEYFSGKPHEPMCDIVFANHVDCRLHFVYEVKTKVTNDYVEIEKLRVVGSKKIDNWRTYVNSLSLLNKC